jgi:hypothetical protein
VFPADPESLESRRVLLILVAEEAPWTAAFVTGIAHWLEGRFSLMCGQPPIAFEVPGTREALAGFDPAILPRLIVPKHSPTVLALAEGVDACVSAFCTAVPPGALTLASPFFGLGKNTSTGACLLFQGPAEMVLAEENVSPEPWAAEQWRPDEDGWKPDEQAMSRDYDPRDDTDIRPHVEFHLIEAAFDSDELFAALRNRAVYHDMMLLDPSDGEVRGFIRFPWETNAIVVDDVAAWLRTLPFVARVFPRYGGPIPRRNDDE